MSPDIGFTLLWHSYFWPHLSALWEGGGDFYDGEGRETERLLMDPEAGSYGCVVPAGSWHTIVALEPTVIMEVKDGRYGEDGSECR